MRLIFDEARPWRQPAQPKSLFSNPIILSFFVRFFFGGVAPLDRDQVASLRSLRILYFFGARDRSFVATKESIRSSIIPLLFTYRRVELQRSGVVWISGDGGFQRDA